MNNNECCKVEAEPRKCVADYEKTTREHLLEARDTLRSVYMKVKKLYVDVESFKGVFDEV